ncbi:MAG: hypothetical protein MI741_05920, partial [Rhodospirillales bacterium]|nr:hypothetical protein [Rhodospirillales bacterium]
MRSKWSLTGLVGAAVFLLANLASATVPTGSPTLIWEIQDSGFGGFTPSAVGMRNGGVFPVMFSTNGDAIALFATENTFTGTNWYEIGTGLYNSGPRFNSATSPDGRIAVANAVNGGGGTVTTLPSGFAALPTGTVSVAFDSAGTLYTADELFVSGVAVAPPLNGDIVDIAVSPFGDIGVVDTSGTFHERSPLLGAWQSTDIDFATGFNFPTFGDTATLSYDAQGRPHVLGINGGDIIAADFSTQ